MRRYQFLSLLPLLFLVLQRSASAQDVQVPAGTLLRCTLNEPDLSSKTASVGDPVLCHVSTVQEFGRAAFPRGAYMAGHLEAEKEPGHFWGKGYLKLVFDRIGLPNTDVPINAKVIAARAFHVDREGDILGKGHAKRDVIEWMLPPLWPWKVLTLPARGPRPTLKGEETLTLRLMEDVTVPRLAASSWPDWRPPKSQASSSTSSEPYDTLSYNGRLNFRTLRYAPPSYPDRHLRKRDLCFAKLRSGATCVASGSSSGSGPTFDPSRYEKRDHLRGDSVLGGWRLPFIFAAQWRKW